RTRSRASPTSSRPDLPTRRAGRNRVALRPRPGADRERSAHEADGGEGLREVPERLAAPRVDLLREQPDVVGVGERAREPPPRRGEGAAAAGQVLGGPERADAEGSFPGLAAPLVTGEEPRRGGEPLADSAPGAAHPRICRVRVAVPGEEQERGVD